MNKQTGINIGILRLSHWPVISNSSAPLGSPPALAAVAAAGVAAPGARWTATAPRRRDPARGRRLGSAEKKIGTAVLEEHDYIVYVDLV